MLGDLAAALRCRLATRSLARSRRACQCCAAVAMSSSTPQPSCRRAPTVVNPKKALPLCDIHGNGMSLLVSGPAGDSSRQGHQ